MYDDLAFEAPSQFPLDLAADGASVPPFEEAPPIETGGDQAWPEFDPAFAAAPGSLLETNSAMGSEGEDENDDDDATWLDEIVVIGDPKEPGDGGGWQPGDPIPDPNGGGDPPDTGGGGGGGPDDDGCGPAADGPIPENVDIGELRSLAESVADEISELNDDWEWGSILYVLDGELFATNPITQQDDSTVGFPLNDPGFLPDGAHIVGWVHSHPWSRGDPSQGYMSADDANAYDTFLQHAGDRYTVDAGLMSYVIDNRSDDLFEFDQSDEEGDFGQNVDGCS